MARRRTKKIGEVAVDSGLLWIGDPGLLFPPHEEAQSALTQEIHDVEQLGAAVVDNAYHVFANLGIAVTPGLGDGLYPIYATFEPDGRISALLIDFALMESEE